MYSSSKAWKSRIDSVEIEPVGIFHLLIEKFNLSELETLVFEFDSTINFEDIPGDTRRAKARELVQYLSRKDKLNKFYDYLNTYLNNH